MVRNEEKPGPSDGADSSAGNDLLTAGSGVRSAAADKDVAVTIVGEQPNAVDPVVASRARRKIDWLLIPTMTVGCNDLSQRLDSPGSFR